ncbi:PKD domain-containing protein [bacterium]|nr:PKD domain-containing protein [bacterium]
MLTTLKSHRKHTLALALISAISVFILIQSVQTSASSYLADILSGRILLQIEEHGEAWYVNPEDNTRIYLRNGIVAYDVMRNFSLGITNEDLARIPVGLDERFDCVDNDQDGLCNKLEEGLGTEVNSPDTDQDGYLDGLEIANGYSPLNPAPVKMQYQQSLVNRLKGKILLQVEKKGQAWYVNPTDGKRYYMKDGAVAYQIMKYLSLGITNDNLAQIPVSSYVVDENQYSYLTYGDDNDQEEVDDSDQQEEEGDDDQDTEISSQAVCGNNQQEPGEECDGAAPAGYYCTDQCQLEEEDDDSIGGGSSGGEDTPSPPQSVCGNNQQEPGEECDGNALEGYYCTDQCQLAEILVPQAQASCPRSLVIRETGSFDASASTDPQGFILSYLWDFNDGFNDDKIVTSTEAIIEYSFKEVGRYQVSLTVSNGHLEDTDTCSVMVTTTFIPDPDPVCGNDLQESGEECDGQDGVPSGYYCSDQCQLVEIVTVISGEDYALPDDVTVEDFSGYVCSSCSNAQSGSMWRGWIDFEPSRGVYDWTSLETGLANLATQGKTGSLHLQSITTGGYNSDNGITVSSEVPDWVFEYYDLDPENLPIVGSMFDITVIPQWQPAIAADFNNMVIALGEAYANDPRLESVYVHGISNSRGEELWMLQPYINNIETDWGLTPSVMYDWLSSRMDAYAEAFAGVEYKVAWVGQAPGYFQDRSDFNQVSTDLFYYAWDKGFGNSNGGIEAYFWQIEQ